MIKFFLNVLGLVFGFISSLAVYGGLMFSPLILFIELNKAYPRLVNLWGESLAEPILIFYDCVCLVGLIEAIWLCDQMTSSPQKK